MRRRWGSEAVLPRTNFFLVFCVVNFCREKRERKDVFLTLRSAGQGWKMEKILFSEARKYSRKRKKGRRRVAEAVLMYFLNTKSNFGACGRNISV